jgi:hypothetical protein
LITSAIGLGIEWRIARSSGGKERIVRLDRDRADHAAGHQEAESMDRIGRVRAQDHVAGRGDRLRHIGKALLGAERRNNLGIRVQLDAETAGIIGGLRAAKARNALGGRIAVGARVLHDLAQFIDHRLRRRKIRIAHAEIDDISSTRSRAGFQTVDLFENVRRQTPDFVKLFHL